MQAVCPPDETYEPAAHAAHVAMPACGAALPGRQDWQAAGSLLLGMGLALPTGHAMHAALLEAPRVGLYVPAGQGVNVCRMLAAPSAAQNPPTGHSSQAVARRASLSLPAGQAMQLLSEKPSFGL